MNSNLGCSFVGAETEAKSALPEAPPPVSLTLNAVERYSLTFSGKMVSPVCIFQPATADTGEELCTEAEDDDPWF